MAPLYPNAYQIEEMFCDRGFSTTFQSHFAENVDINVIGKEFGMGGNYKDAKSFQESTYEHVMPIVKVDTIRIEVVKVIGGGDSAWAAVESWGTCTTKKAEFKRLEADDDRPRIFFSYLLTFSLEYISHLVTTWLTDHFDELIDKQLTLECVDLVRFNSQGKIAYMKEFFDMAHVHSHLAEHEEKPQQEEK